MTLIWCPFLTVIIVIIVIHIFTSKKKIGKMFVGMKLMSYLCTHNQ